MSDRFVEIKGVSDDLRIYENKVTIKPRGILGLVMKGMKGTKEIPFHSISAIQFKEVGMMNGMLQFTISGGVENTKGIWDAHHDENTFVFDAKTQAAVKKAKDFIEERIMHLKGVITHAAPMSKADEIAKLAALKDSGALTQEEFDKLKKDLMKVG